MIALLRSAGFYYPDGTAIFLDVRRLHDTGAQADNKTFQFMRRCPRAGLVSIKDFGTYREAMVFWNDQVVRLEGEGLARRDPEIVGFHEEG